jgi:hypothetical protein
MIRRRIISGPPMSGVLLVYGAGKRSPVLIGRLKNNQ